MITLILIGLITTLIYFFYKSKFSYWQKRGIKGPKAYPIIGTLLAEIKYHPLEVEKKFLDQYGPVFGTYFSSKPIFNTSRIEDIKTVLSDLKTFPNIASFQFNDKYLQNSIFLKNGMDWKLGRSAQAYYFTGKKFRNLLPHFEKVTSNFLENLSNTIRETKSIDVDVKKLAKYYGIDCIAKVLFAIEMDSFKERESNFSKSASGIGEINEYSSMLIAILPKSLSSFLGLQPFNLEPLENLGDYFKNLIKERRKSGIKYNDLTEVLQDAVDNNKCKMNEDELIGNILLSFLAETDPVSNVLSQMMKFLAEDKNVQEKLYDEMKNEFGDSDEITYEKLTQNEYLDAVVNETLRLSNTVLNLIRTARVDTQLGEYKIEKGTEIRLITCVPHLLSDQYMDPRNFNPDRFLRGSNESQNFFIPFGMGHKICLGQRLALLIIKYLIARLLPKYELCKAKDSEIKLKYCRGFCTTSSLKVGFLERV